MPHGIVLDEARQVVRDLDLPPWWLNEQAMTYISQKDDQGKRRVFDHPGLRGMAASPEYVFAMKSLAARPGPMPLGEIPVSWPWRSTFERLAADG